MTDETMTTTAESPVEPAYVAPPAPADAVIEKWFAETFFNRFTDPDEMNRIIAAKDRLKSLLANLKE